MNEATALETIKAALDAIPQIGENRRAILFGVIMSAPEGAIYYPEHTIEWAVYQFAKPKAPTAKPMVRRRP